VIGPVRQQMRAHGLCFQWVKRSLRAVQVLSQRPHVCPLTAVQSQADGRIAMLLQG